MVRIRKPRSHLLVVIKFLQGVSLLAAMLVYFSTFNIVFAALTLFMLLGGSFAAMFLIRHRRRKRYLTSGLNVVDKMSGTEFEEFLLVHFKQLGYKARTTPTTGDYGADLILEKDGIKTVVQAKRWGQKVGVEAVQQILAAMGYYKASKAIVITNNYCSENAHVLANANNIEIWNRDELQKFMNKTNGKASAVYVAGNSTHSLDICPECSGKLIKRHGKYGEFWGCSSYPGCRYVRNSYSGSGNF